MRHFLMSVSRDGLRCLRGGPGVWLLALAAIVASPSWAAESPIDRSEPLRRVGEGFGLPDGPAWSSQGWLVVGDVKRKTVHRYDPETSLWEQVPGLAERYSGLFAAGGKLYAANNSGGGLDYFPGGLVDGVARASSVPLPLGADEKPARPNDIAVDRVGGVYVTITSRDEVLYVDPRGDVRVATTAVPSPNGLILAPDQRVLYVANYRGKTIERLPVVSPGKLGQSQRFAEMDDGDALGADGMTVDREGNVYCAGATAVWVWNEQGRLLDQLECPTRPINATFGGEASRSLFVTCFDGVYVQPMRVAGCD
jgi:gluconolactonase